MPALLLHAVLTALFALVVAGTAAGVGATSESAVERAALNGATRAADFVQFGVDRGMRSELAEGWLSPGTVARLDRSLPRRGDRAFSELAIRTPAGRVLYSSTDGVAGSHHTVTPAFRRALAGDSTSVVCSAQTPCEEDEPGATRSVQTYLPVRLGRRVVGVYELEFSYRPLAADLRRAHERTTLVIGIAAAALWLALLPLTWRLARLVVERWAPRRAILRRRLRQAIGRGEIEVHFQPKVDPQSRRTVGAEALVRWRHRGRLVPPGRFLPHVEGPELMRRLTDEVLDQALAQAGRWARAGTPVPVAVNVFAVGLVDGSLPGRVGRVLGRHGVAPHLLTLEVTETAVLEETEATRATLVALSAMGVRVSVDDFGTGHSSLARLLHFPVDEVKIDRSFVAAMAADGTRHVAAILRLAADLGIEVVAEGVETEQTCAQLRDLGCPVVQGYLFAPALDAAAFGARLAEQDAARSDALDRIVAEDVRSTFDAVLREARETLGMEIAWIAELRDGTKHLRWVDGGSAGCSFGLAAGGDMPAGDSYCQRVVDGRVEALVPDTAREPAVRDLAITHEARIGSYAGVPIELPDGRVYGTLCCASHDPLPGLSDRDAAFLRVVARLVGQELARKEAEWSALRAAAQAADAPA